MHIILDFTKLYCVLTSKNITIINFCYIKHFFTGPEGNSVFRGPKGNNAEWSKMHCFPEISVNKYFVIYQVSNNE